MLKKTKKRRLCVTEPPNLAGKLFRQMRCSLTNCVSDQKKDKEGGEDEGFSHWKLRNAVRKITAGRVFFTRKGL